MTAAERLWRDAAERGHAQAELRLRLLQLYGRLRWQPVVSCTSRMGGVDSSCVSDTCRSRLVDPPTQDDRHYAARIVVRCSRPVRIFYSQQWTLAAAGERECCTQQQKRPSGQPPLVRRGRVLLSFDAG